MKRLKFNTQLVLLYSGILLVIITIFGFSVESRVKDVSKTQTIDRLEQYIDITETSWLEGKEIEVEKVNFHAATIQGVLIKNNENYNVTNVQTSGNITDYVPNNKMNSVFSKIKLTPGEKGNGVIEIEDEETIFYSYSVEQTKDSGDEINFILLVTNQELVKEFRKGISVQITFIFIVVNLFAFIIIGFWSNYYVSRTNRIKGHVANLQKTGYKEKYVDDGNDELAELSRSIENLRLEILNHEEIKQEILQNVSHDFKTPIAVIKSYAEAILDGMAPSEDAQIIINHANNLHYKVTKLLQYNRLEYLENDKEFEEISMKDLIETVVDSYRFQIKDINFELKLDDTKFKGYSENFYTVVDNIIDNAQRYAKTTIKVTLKNGVLKIYNDGVHIDEQFLNGLFKAYEKGFDGQFGLGMSIVKKTLDFFEYELLVENLEVGVEFTIQKKKKEIIYKY